MMGPERVSSHKGASEGLCRTVEFDRSSDVHRRRSW